MHNVLARDGVAILNIAYLYGGYWTNGSNLYAQVPPIIVLDVIDIPLRNVNIQC